MARFFTLYLPSDICEWHYANKDSGLAFTAAPGSMISHSDIAPGDMVYGINVVVGTLFLIGRMKVERCITSHAEAVKLLGNDAWETPEYLVAAEGSATPMYFSRQLPWEIAMELRLLGSEGKEMSLPLIDGEEIDSKQLREVRELSPASAKLLDEFLTEAFEELLQEEDLDDDGEIVGEEVIYGFEDDDLEGEDDFDEDDDDDLTDEELAAIAMDFESGEQFAAVAEAATGIVTDYFHNEGFRVSMADDDSFYDLRCNKDEEEYHVLVYGTPQDELRFLMTDEDLAAATEDDNALVCVVTNADTAAEAELSIFDPDSLLDDFLYRPLQWGFWYAGDDDVEFEEEEDGEEVKE